MAEERSSAATFGYTGDQDDEQGGYEPSPSPKHHRKDTKRYVAFRSDDDESSEFEVDETPRKDRKKLKKDRSNTFKEKFKSIKVKKREKESKEKSKEKEKEEKKEKKEKKKHKRSLSAGASLTPANVPSPPPANPIFGVKLELAVARSKLADGIELPTIFRQCIQYLEENGLDQEGLYRVSGIKSKIDELKYMYDHGMKIDLEADDIEPNIVAGLLKQYLRELPTNILTQKLQAVFDALIGLRDESEQVEQMKYLLNELPKPNYTLLSWLFVHLHHVMKNFSQTKMNIQNISIVFSPTMNISHGVLYIILTHVDSIFPNVKILKYVEPAEPEVKTGPAKSPTSLAEELAKQEVFLDNLHAQMKQEGANEEEVMEQMWEIQRTVTQLKRKLKTMRKIQLEQSAIEDESLKKTVMEKGEDAETEHPEVLVIEKPATEEKLKKPEGNQEAVDGKVLQGPRKKRLVDIARQSEEEVEESGRAVHVRRQKRNEEHARILEKCKEITKPNEDIVEAKKDVVDVRADVVEAKEDVAEAKEDAVEAKEDVVEAKEDVTKNVEKPDEEQDNVDRRESEEVLKDVGLSEDLADEDANTDDEEMTELLREEFRLKIEQEELLALSGRLKDRIQGEWSDVERLRLKIDEIKKRDDYISPASSSDDDSSVDGSDSESGSDSDSDNSEVENILKELQKENEKLENQTVDLVKALMEENDKCVQLNVDLRIMAECKAQ